MKKLIASIGVIAAAVTGILFSAPAGPGGTQGVGLAWDANTETDIAGYRIYYGHGAELTNMVNVGNVVQHPMKLGRGVWTFYATCYNTSGLESEPSNMVSWTNNTPGQIRNFRLK